MRQYASPSKQSSNPEGEQRAPGSAGDSSQSSVSCVPLLVFLRLTKAPLSLPLSLSDDSADQFCRAHVYLYMMSLCLSRSSVRGSSCQGDAVLPGRAVNDHRGQRTTWPFARTRAVAQLLQADSSKIIATGQKRKLRFSGRQGTRQFARMTSPTFDYGYLYPKLDAYIKHDHTFYAILGNYIYSGKN